MTTETTTEDPRTDLMRWTTHRGIAHLWLGHSTACGLNPRNLSSDGGRDCRTCSAYARGWLDRHDTGPNPQPHEPNPQRRTVPAATSGGAR